MILFMPWPVQKYITTHLYIIAEFVERGKWGRRCLLLHFALAPLHTHCALFQNCFALLSRFARYSSIASHFSRALRVIPELLRTSLALCALFQYCFALLSRFARYSSIAPHFVLPQFCAAFTLRPVGLRVHVASSRQMRYMPRASSRMCALDGIITRKKHPACDIADRMPLSYFI